MIAGSLLGNLNCFVSIKMKSDGKRTICAVCLSLLGYPFKGARPLEWPPASGVSTESCCQFQCAENVASALLTTHICAGYPALPAINPDFLPIVSGIGQKGYLTGVPFESDQYPGLW